MIKKILAILLLGFSSVYAQTEQTTPNLITSGTTHTWTGVTTGALPANYMPGGPSPIYDPSTNTVSFSYNANATVAQTIAINNALANAGAGVKINGYNYSYDIRNMNGDNRQGGTDTLNVYQALVGTNGTNLLSSQQTYNTKFDWKSVSGSQTANNPIDMADAARLTFKMVGGDNGYWAGYFGPQVRNVNMSLSYTVDPCATNPAYSPTCANYNTVAYSNNLVPNPNGYAVYGSSIDQTYAINQALQQSGSGVMIHGFQWGYVANANGPYCTSWDILGCWGTVVTPSVTTNVNITDVNNNSLYSVSRTYTNSYNTTSYQYLFPSSRNLSTLGSFKFTATTNDAAYVGSMWSKAVYTPDPCTVNPLSSTSCSGYQQAYLDQQCAGNPLYSTQCAGYAVAYFTQQCSANALYDPTCPGYATAYLNYQCSTNPLYSTTCAGYETAYFNQQCSINPLYNSRCSGYDQAYLTQQCSINPLYSTTCSGYARAYHDQQCSINPLYATDCSGYAAAYLNQQCASNPLYSTQCSGYATAYKAQQCSLNPLYATDCPGYATAYFNQQCSLNPLYDSQCAGYRQAYFNQQCSLNPLYNANCTGYTQAYHDQQCSINALYATDCAGYQAAYKTQQCTLNPLYATDCPGYAAAYKSQQCSINSLYATDCPNYATAYFNQQCSLNGLYDQKCPNYATAYAKKMLFEQQGTASIIATAGVVAATAPKENTSAVTSSTSTSDGSSSVAVPVVADPIVNQAVTSTATSTSPAAAATATVSLAPAPANAPQPPPPQERKPEGGPAPAGGPPMQGQGPQGEKPQPTARQQLAERRAEAAKKEAVEKGKNLANEMGKAADMESQKQVQNVVIQAMGFTPGFDNYNKVMMFDTVGYKPFTVYNGQVNVDNKRLGWGLYGPSDRLHNDLVESQYRGN